MACKRGDNNEVEQCLSDGADVNHENVSSDYYCTDEDSVSFHH